MRLRTFGVRLTATVSTVLFVACPTSASAVIALKPIHLEPSHHIAWEADKSTGGDVCTVESHDECQSLKSTTEAGGFDYPDSVAADPRTGNMFVAEIDDDRVQELTAAGAFVSMFGGDVNKTSDKSASARQAERDVCTAASEDACGAGVGGTAIGLLDEPASVAVDPETGDFYVLEIAAGDLRVDKYTRDGRFLWRIGKDVNLTTRANLCTAQEIDLAGARCGGGRENSSDSTEHGAFKFANQSGDLLAAGGPENLLYVGDEHRVQVFGSNGEWKREILLASLSAQPHSSIVALALQRSGDLYVVYRVGPVENYLPTEHANIVRKFNPHGDQVAEYPIRARSPVSVDSINGLAIDPYGRLALIGVDVGPPPNGRFGLLLNAATGRLISEFTPPVDDDGIAFNGEDELYFATAVDQEVAVYAPALPEDLAIEPVGGF